MNIKINWLGAVLLLLAATAISIFLVVAGVFERGSSAPTKLSYEELTGSVFLPTQNEPFRAPRVRELLLPTFENATSIWGATGRDARGHIWMGVSARSSGKSAHLFEYDPDGDAWQDRGAVTDKLKDVSLYSEGEGQVKIHSRIVPAGDGWLYFASTDEEGENAAIDAPPRWGGHLWRIHPERYTWQHLFAAREGLVAVSGAGRYVYALGYWGHVLYQYDTETARAKRVVVGSAGGHVSRNFLSDVRGHAYVPRLTAASDGSVSVALVEYDPSLKEIAATTLDFYLDKNSLESNHGIVALAYLPDGRMLFSTHLGHLYRIEPRQDERSPVTAVGWLHREGQAYAPSLFSFGGNSLVAGIARRPAGFDWVVSSLEPRVSSSFPLELGALRKVLLYGSITRDNAGRLYVGGWAENEKTPGQQRPLALQIDPGK
jgi:hypothetical protein